MALIKCPDCGNTISDKATSCPRCGCPVRSRMQYRGNDDTQILHREGNARVHYKKKSNSDKWLYAIIALLSLLLLAGGAYYFLTKEKKDKDVTDSTPTTEMEGSAPATSSKFVNQEIPAAPRTSVKQETPPMAAPAMRNKVANGNYRLNGVITHKQNYYIDMELNIRGNQATGRYIVYNGENIYVTLSGTIDANGNMKLTEYKDGQTTGYYFTGRFNQSTYSGTYRCTYRKLTMKFSASTY